MEISGVGREKVALSEMGGTVHNNIVQTLQGKGSKGKGEWCFRCRTKGQLSVPLRYFVIFATELIIYKPHV